MNYIELQEQIAQWSHRTDLAKVIPEFIDNVSQRLGRRFGVMPAPLVKDTDTNSVLTTHSQLYLLGGLREQAIYTHDAVAAQAYEALYQIEIGKMNITYADTDWAACDSPVMCPPD